MLPDWVLSRVAWLAGASCHPSHWRLTGWPVVCSWQPRRPLPPLVLSRVAKLAGASCHPLHWWLTLMACRVQLATPTAAAPPGAIPGRIIGGRELPTSPLTTDSDGSPCAAGNPGGSRPPWCYPWSHNWRARAATLATDDWLGAQTVCWPQAQTAAAYSSNDSNEFHCK